MKIRPRPMLRIAAPASVRVIVTLMVAVALPVFSFGQEPGSKPEMAPMGAQASGSGDSKPLPSPPAVAEVMLDGKPIRINYSTPKVRGRVIMGGLVPYGKVWRTGANPATSFVTAGNLQIGDLMVPTGSYTLYTLPAEPKAHWLLILNKQTGQWGTVYNQNLDLGRTRMKSAILPTPQEVMSISFEKTTKRSTELHIRWENTDEWVKIEAL